MRFVLDLVGGLVFVVGCAGLIVTGFSMGAKSDAVLAVPVGGQAVLLGSWAAVGFWVNSIVTGGVLCACAEVMGYVRRRMRQLDAEDRSAAAQARAAKHAAKQAKRDAKARKRAGRTDAPIDFQVLDGGDQHGGN